MPQSAVAEFIGNAFWQEVRFSSEYPVRHLPSPCRAANAQGGIHIATGIACRAVLITGTTPEMPIGIIAGMRERGGLKKVSEIVAWSPVEVSPF